MDDTSEVTAGHRYTNRLANETSPYLLQHAHNPVDWYPWGAEALERAKREDRPIFLSIGYSACHWCHVMERESFEDTAIAEQMNRDFVPIKVDREERPDLDEVYMAAVQAMTGSGGWPMNVFLTPDLQPFYGGTYFPPNDRHGLPGFPRVLAGVADAYRSRRDEVASQAGLLARHLREQLALPPGGADPQRDQLDGAVRRLGAAFDSARGGFGGAPKFPAPMTLEFLLRVWRRSQDPDILRMVTVTLDAMANGGIQDQLGGGFARYSIDADWLVPHFEKMLYDNAQLAHAYLEAFRATGEARYRAVVESTLDFVLRELATSDGGFASALDADSEGEEGRFYVWTDAELRSVLVEAGLSASEADEVARYWDVTPEGNWEGRSILRGSGSPPDAELIARARKSLLAARGRRVRPARDEKQIAAWNGLLLRSLAEAAGPLEETDYLAAADGIAGFVRKVLLQPDGALWRTARDGVGHTPAFLEDYACLADGLLALHAALGRGDDLLLVRQLMDRAIADFWDEEAGTFWDTSDAHEAIVARPRSVIDGATPAGNSVAADVLLRLALLTGEADYDRRARSILRIVGDALDRQPQLFGRMLGAVDRSLSDPIDVVIATTPGDAGDDLRAVAHRGYSPNLVVATLNPGDATAQWSLFVDKRPLEGKPTAYVCRGYACRAPTSDAAKVERQIADLENGSAAP
ncbi:MAG: thioredoxin domain-containing protein [Chloroflexi bacterium]|nr:MAG: thioredoxin domain-containing protein [Chloroflexota bacterium]